MGFVPQPNLRTGVYVILMGKVVGACGETLIRIVVKPGTNQVITAYLTP